MKRVRLSFLWSFLFPLLHPVAAWAGAPHPREAAARLAALSLRFERNVGQIEDPVRFLARGPGYGLFLTKEGATLALSSGGPSSRRGPALSMHLVGARGDVEPQGEAKLDGVTNYFIGPRSRWRSGVDGYARVVYRAVLPGVDLAFYGTRQRRLEYDVLLGPGVDPQSVVLAFDGSQTIDLAPDGGAVLRLPGGFEVVQPPPKAYQVGPFGRRERVDVRFERRAAGLGFALGRRDATRPVVIDPTLVYSTFLGGSGADGAVAIALDAAGNMVIAGNTESANFPITSSLSSFCCGSVIAAFVTKLNASGSALVYSTYIGAEGNNSNAAALALDSAGNAFLAGNIQVKLADGGALPLDAFVTKVSADGSAILYSARFGGSSDDQANGIAVTPSGEAIATGNTSSPDFPTVAALQPSACASCQTGFVAKLTVDGSHFVYSTYLGGSKGAAAAAVATDAAGDAVVVGSTSSTDFPTANAIQRTLVGGTVNAIVSKLTPDGSSFVYSTYLNPTGYPVSGANAVACDASGDAFVAAGASDPSSSSPPGRFVWKINPSGSSLLFQSALTGGGALNGIALAPSGQAVVVGTSQSVFGYEHGIDILNVAPSGTSNASIFHMECGVAGPDGPYCQGAGIALDAIGNPLIVGSTNNPQFPTVAPLQPVYGGTGDAIVAKVVVVPPVPALGGGWQVAFLGVALLAGGALSRQRRTPRALRRS